MKLVHDQTLNETWFRTDSGHKHTHWILEHRHESPWPVIRSLYNPHTPALGFVWPDRLMPGFPPGYVVFLPSLHPTVGQVRDWFPDHRELWDAVEDEHSDVR